VRHAEARTCTVSVRLSDTLDLDVSDDGCGLPAACHAGVGLPSMRERAAELGGTCDITSTPGQGTRLRVRLPRHIG
jgi:signal transduction histidine kinase